MLIKRVKRHPDPRSGTLAAEIYRGRKLMSPARASTLRKTQRYYDIQSGQKPLCYGVPEKR